MSAQPEYMEFHEIDFPKGQFATLQELYDFIIDHYEMETNIETNEFRDILDKAEVILLGETHNSAEHTKSNGQLVNALWNGNTELFIEHEPIGADGQLVFVEPSIANTARQWDFTESHTSAAFDKLLELSSLITDDFRDVTIRTTKELLASGARLIDEYLIRPTSVENGWSLIDHQMARILDEQHREPIRIQLMLKQAYLRVWVDAAYETLDRFLTILESEVEERNGWMAKNIEKALHRDKKVLLIAGSEHLTQTITSVKKKEIENPVLRFLRDTKKKYLILQPTHDETITQAKEISEELLEITGAETSLLEKEAIHLCQQLLSHGEDAEIEEEFETIGRHEIFEQYLEEMDKLKAISVEIIEESSIESHEQALHEPYMTGAICLRVDKLAKTIQIWNVIAEIALAHHAWLVECRDVLGLEKG